MRKTCFAGCCEKTRLCYIDFCIRCHSRKLANQQGDAGYLPRVHREARIVSALWGDFTGSAIVTDWITSGSMQSKPLNTVRDPNDNRQRILHLIRVQVLLWLEEQTQRRPDKRILVYLSLRLLQMLLRRPELQLQPSLYRMNFTCHGNN